MTVPQPRLARLYFLVQALAVIAWWLLLWVHPEVRPLFSIEGAPDVALVGFAPGDVSMLGGGSLAIAAAGRSRWAPVLAWIVAGATLYAALYTLAIAIAGASSWLGVALMTPAAVLSTLSASSLFSESFPRAVRSDLSAGRTGD